MEIEVPIDIAELGIDAGEIRFEPGIGLEELLHVWGSIAKRVV